ncbi:MAG: hypothetical protein WDM89_10315 [Rhizomicrobium sp.]
MGQGTRRRTGTREEFLAALESAGELSIAKLTLANSQIRELAAR